MKSIGFSIYDTKAEAFMPPFFMPSVGLGIRAFSDVCKDANSNVGKHLSDFRLYKVGEFDDNSGDFDNAGNIAPVMLCTGTEAKGFD